MLPAWFGGLFSNSQWPTFFGWYPTCVACLCFYPMLETLWALRREPIVCGILLGIDAALPYGFTAMIFSEMWISTSGLGFAAIVAGAAVQTDKGFAIALITISLLTILSVVLRKTAAMLCALRRADVDGYETFPARPTTITSQESGPE
jgi:hypothetical protein